MGRLQFSTPTKLALVLFLAFFTLVLPKSSHASHIMAGDLTYRFLGGLSYEITLKLYRDCNGVDLANTATVRMRSSCYRDTNAVLNLLNGSGNLLPLLCPAQQSNSSCLGGNLLGVKEYIYLDTVDLPTSCFDWQFSWTSCCRNAAITNLTSPHTRSFYLEAYLNHEFTSGNSSPSFGSIPTPYICVGQPFSYTQGTSEVDGDSMVFSLVSPQTSAVGTIPHVTGFSPTQPVSPAITISPFTGQLFFTPNVPQVAIVSVLVEEYRNDSLIGSARRDIQVIALNCNNTFPFLTPSQASSVLPPAVQSSPLVLEICPDNLLSFVLQGIDLDFGDSVFVEPVGNLPLGVTLTPSPNLVSGSLLVEWLPTASDIGVYIWEFLVRDNNCPLLGIQRYAVTVKVLDRTRAGPDLFYCPAGGPVQLGAIGGRSFVWTEVGMAILDSGELSCDSCPNPLAAPTKTTTYVVTSDLGNCINTDTVTVNVVPDILLTTQAVQDTICRGDTAQLFAIPFPSSNVTFDWQPKGSLRNSGTLAPRAHPAKQTMYTVTVTSPAGCRVKDTVMIEVIDLDVTALAPKDKVCRADSTVELHAQVSSNVPYILQWKDPLGANMGQTDSIRFTGLLSGLYSVHVCDSTQLCAANDSAQIDVLDLVVLPGSQSICAGDSVTLNSTYLGPTGLFFPGQCGPTDSCCGPRYYYTIGDTCTPLGGSAACQTSGLQSTVYRASFEASRIQYLYKENELLAKGFFGGTIESIAFHVSWTLIQGPNPEIDEVVIKMGCTSEDTLTDFVDGLTTVWGPAPLTPQMGYNVHMLDLPYDWTGGSNLVIQVCGIDTSNSGTIAFFETSANTFGFPTTVKADRFIAQAPCELTADTGLIYQRPTIQFGVCVEGLNPVYTWTPAAGLSNPNIPNPKASPAANTTYTLNVSVADSCICQLEEPTIVQVNGCILQEAILDFEVEKVGNAALLRWHVDPSFAASPLWIEKQIEGEFKPLFMGSGLPEESRWDRNLPEGEHLYRVRITDINGQSSFSETKSVFITSQGPNTHLYPNPVRRGDPVFFQYESSPRDLTIYNALGKVVYQDKNGSPDYISTHMLTPGIYFVHLGFELHKLTIKE